MKWKCEMGAVDEGFKEADEKRKDELANPRRTG